MTINVRSGGAIYLEYFQGRIMGQLYITNRQNLCKMIVIGNCVDFMKPETFQMRRTLDINCVQYIYFEL